jgi:predicted MPP superfamily phosphohydrolase
MSTLKVSNFARQGYSIVFPLFLFFSAIFCMSTRTNNLLHLSILLLLLSLVRQENRQALAGVTRAVADLDAAGGFLYLLRPQ